MTDSGKENMDVVGWAEELTRKAADAIERSGRPWDARKGHSGLAQAAVENRFSKAEPNLGGIVAEMRSHEEFIRENGILQHFGQSGGEALEQGQSRMSRVTSSRVGAYLQTSMLTQMMAFSGATQTLGGMAMLAKTIRPKAAVEAAELKQVRMRAVKSVAIGAAVTAVGVGLMRREVNRNYGRGFER